TFTLNPATVNYVYSANDYKLTSTFKDAQGQELKAPVIDAKTYHIQDTYKTTVAVIPGYTLVATPKNDQGTFGANNVTVNYVYQTNDYTLTSTFKDAQGNELKATEVDAQKYHIHDTYTSKAAVIPGYTLEKTPTNETGTLNASDIQVNYVYKKDAIIKPITPAKPTILTIKTPASKVIKTKVVKQTLPKTGDDDAGLLNLLRLIGLVLILG
ncbi:TPA: MucBP domain-containing protein, partial [Listeria monocytogenes]|nr:MucBP domain-containing protein [Listeria monocytogenes]